MRAGISLDDAQGIDLVCVDLQREFTDVGGKSFRPRQCIGFITEVLVPFLHEQGVHVAEIKSDYRQPRHLDSENYCVPGTSSYESLLPDRLRRGSPWVKAHNHPNWTRTHAGDAALPTGYPYCDAAGFHRWLDAVLRPGLGKVVLFGLSLDCCLMCTAQELNHRGHEVLVLDDAVDTFSGGRDEKRRLLDGGAICQWASPLDWDGFRQLLNVSS